MSPVRRSKNRFNTPQVVANFTEHFLTPARVIPESPRSQRLMTFIINPSHGFNRLVRKDTGLVAFETNIFTLRTTYQFTKFILARAIIDYNTLNQRVRAQFLYGWTPNPGTASYGGYNDDLNYAFNAISSSIVPGFRRNGRTFFVKISYLFRKSF